MQSLSARLRAQIPIPPPPRKHYVLCANNSTEDIFMPHLNRDGVELYYEVHGQGPALLLTHGYSSTSHMWKGQIEPFSKHFKLIIWDMRGHGRTSSPHAPSLYSEEHTVADMAALLSH